MDGLSGSASLLTDTVTGQPLFHFRLEGAVLEGTAVGSCRTAGTLPAFFSSRLYQDAMKALDAPASYERLCHPVQESHGCCPCQLGGSTAGRQTSLALPPALLRGGKGRTVCWRIGTMQDRGESIGLMKQEPLGRVLALETCQKWDNCRSAISDPYSWLFPGSIHSPFPAVLGWR